MPVSEKTRSIAHVDMDAFYASVEQRDHPDLRNRPVLVGGAGRRGVVAAASYEARKFGVHSALPMLRARQLCPGAIVVPPRMKHYQQVSSQVFEIFHRFTPLVEGLSLDEAFLDVTGSIRLLGSARSIAEQIKQAIADELKLVASVGLAANKFLAKLASDYGKPDGLLEVEVGQELAFLDPLPVGRLWGVGRKAEAILLGAGVMTVEALRLTPRTRLVGLLGESLATHLANLSHGMDDRNVVVQRGEKSISHETTFEYDVRDLSRLQKTALGLSSQVGQRLRRKGLAAGTVAIKLRTADFRTRSRSCTLDAAVAGDLEIYRTVRYLLNAWWAQSGPAPIRLLGVAARSLGPPPQPDLLAALEHPGLDDVSDDIRRRFGAGMIKPGRLLEK